MRLGLTADVIAVRGDLLSILAASSHGDHFFSSSSPWLQTWNRLWNASSSRRFSQDSTTASAGLLQ